jgi:hypothetical protein
LGGRGGLEEAHDVRYRLVEPASVGAAGANFCR